MSSNNSFWADSDYGSSSIQITNQIIEKAERKIGFKLPDSYKNLLKIKNGGVPRKKCFKIRDKGIDYIEITALLGVGGKKGIDSDTGSNYLIKEWGFFKEGVVFGLIEWGDSVVMLDYREIKNGIKDPSVVYAEEGGRTIHLAATFDDFIKELDNFSEYENSIEDLKKALYRIEYGKFSNNLSLLINHQNRIPNLEEKIRAFSKLIANEKGGFFLHGDEKSLLMYDIQFWLLYSFKKLETIEEFYKIYPTLIALADEFSTEGYSAQFLSKWFEIRSSSDKIIGAEDGFRFSIDFESEFLQKIDKIEF